MVFCTFHKTYNCEVFLLYQMFKYLIKIDIFCFVLVKLLFSLIFSNVLRRGEVRGYNLTEQIFLLISIKQCNYLIHNLSQVVNVRELILS